MFPTAHSHLAKIAGKKRKSCKKCSHEGCTNNAKSRGLCKRHGGGMRCQAKGCGTSARPGGYCITHGGGLCKIAGCTTGARSGGLCLMHQRIGEMREKRAAKLIELGESRISDNKDLVETRKDTNAPGSVLVRESAVDLHTVQDSSSVFSDYASSSCSTLDQTVNENLDFYETGIIEPFPLHIKAEQRRLDSAMWSSETHYNHMSLFDTCNSVDIPVSYPSENVLQGNNVHLPESHLDDILSELQAYRGSMFPSAKTLDSAYYHNMEDTLEKLVALQPYPLVYNNNNILFR